MTPASNLATTIAPSHPFRRDEPLTEPLLAHFLWLLPIPVLEVLRSPVTSSLPAGSIIFREARPILSEAVPDWGWNGNRVRDVFGSDEVPFYLYGVQDGSSAIGCEMIEEVAIPFINRHHCHLGRLMGCSDIDVGDTQQLSSLTHTVGRTARTPTWMAASTEIPIGMTAGKAGHPFAFIHALSSSVPASSISRYRLRMVTSLTFAASDTTDCVT